MADPVPVCMLSSGIDASEMDSEAMHVDITPSTSDREDEQHSSVPEIVPDAEFNSLFVDTSREKLDQRAQRFGVEPSTVRQITETDVKSLYKSLDVDLKEIASSLKPGKSRLDTVHMRGVNEMSTQDVFDYFKDHSPVSVEWVNDLSCNIVCLDPLCAARALLSLSQPIRRVPVISEQKGSREEAAAVSEPEEGEDVEMTENEVPVPKEFDGASSVSHSRRSSGDNVATPVPNNSPIDASQIDDSAPLVALASANIGVEIDSNKIDVPLPPGPWRLGHTTIKAKGVLMRLANRADRKIQGAEKLSQYYLQHGNPNFKGLKGIISTSMKRKLKEGYKRKPYVDLDAVDDDVQYPVAPLQELVPEYKPRISKEQIPKRPRMRMYADDEEEKQKSKPVTTAVISSTSRDPADLRNRISSDRISSRSATDRSDLRSKLASSWSSRSASHHRQNFDSLVDDGNDFEYAEDDASSDGEVGGDRIRYKIDHHLSRPIVLRDLRSKLEQLRQARQPKVPLLIEVSQDDV